MSLWCDWNTCKHFAQFSIFESERQVLFARRQNERIKEGAETKKYTVKYDEVLSMANESCSKRINIHRQKPIVFVHNTYSYLISIIDLSFSIDLLVFFFAYFTISRVVVCAKRCRTRGKKRIKHNRKKKPNEITTMSRKWFLDVISVTLVNCNTLSKWATL